MRLVINWDEFRTIDSALFKMQLDYARDYEILMKECKTELAKKVLNQKCKADVLREFIYDKIE